MSVDTKHKALKINPDKEEAGLPVVMEKKTTFRDISARKHPLVIGKKGNWPDIMFNSILQNDRGNSDTL